VEDRSGPLGCSCALLPGIILGVVLYVGVGLLIAPASESIPDESNAGVVSARVALSEDYLSDIVSAMISSGPTTGWSVDIQPGEEMVFSSQVTAKAFGSEIALPVSIRVRVHYQGGDLRLVPVEMKLPGGIDPTVGANSVNPILESVADKFRSEMLRATGGVWDIEAIHTTDRALVLSLTGRGVR